VRLSRKCLALKAFGHTFPVKVPQRIDADQSVAVDGNLVAPNAHPQPLPVGIPFSDKPQQKAPVMATVSQVVRPPSHQIS
jgi:hypothetical protein